MAYPHIFLNKDLFFYFLCFSLSYAAVRLYRQTILCSLPVFIRHREDNVPIANGAGSALWDVSLLFSIYLILYRSAPASRILLILFATLSFMILGWVDDWLELKPQTKFFWQTLFALIWVPQYCRSAAIEMPLPGQFFLILLLVWLVNAVNLLDILDGLASSLGIMILGMLAFFAVQTGQSILSVFCLFWCFSLMGFLVQNMVKPSVFLGDAGAHLLGSVLFFVSLEFYSYSSLSPLCSISILLALFGFIGFDFSYVCLRRLLKKIPPFRKSEDHLMFAIFHLTRSRIGTLIIFLFFQSLACLLAWKCFLRK
jgi:UDP-GlcNAc:undecaprenyl-phosphate/decaprenyl-phosphate GlcNAc-1-phosphate transferase